MRPVEPRCSRCRARWTSRSATAPCGDSGLATSSSRRTSRARGTSPARSVRSRACRSSCRSPTDPEAPSSGALGLSYHRRLEFSERKECRSKVEAKIDGLFARLASLGEMPEGRQRLLEAAHRLPVRRTRTGLEAGLTQVGDGPFPHLTAHGMMREAFDVLGEPIRMGTFDRADDPGVKLLAPLFEQGAVGHFMRERVLEGVLGIREEPRLVEELRCLQPRESTLEVILGHLRDDP